MPCHAVLCHSTRATRAPHQLGPGAYTWFPLFLIALPAHSQLIFSHSAHSFISAMRILAPPQAAPPQLEPGVFKSKSSERV